MSFLYVFPDLEEGDTRKSIAEILQDLYQPTGKQFEAKLSLFSF